MTISHWLYVIGVLVVVVTMILRRNVIIPCILFTFLIGWVYLGSFVGGVQAVFNSGLVAAKDLFSIFLIISMMVAMLKAISTTGADRLLVKPLQNSMKTPMVSYLVLIAATYFISIFFWPTPAVPLIGALLAPAAVKAGLPPMMAAVAISLAGQGMALGGDIIIQGAPGMSAAAAGIDVSMVTFRTGVLSITTGIIAISMAWWMNRNEIKSFQPASLEAAAVQLNDESPIEKAEYGSFFKYLLIVAMLCVVVAMFLFDIKGGDASSLLGGTAMLIMVVAAIMVKGVQGLDVIGDWIADGLVFAFKVMGAIIPIAGFFFLGNPEAVVGILGKDAPGFLFDVGKIIASVIPPSGVLAGFGMLIIGAITGLDGSGFSGLPLTGTLAGAMASGNASIAASLAAIGQIGAIWTGGGTIIAWSSLVAVAGIVGVPVLDLVRKNMIPVLTGMAIATIVGIMMI